MSSPGFTDSTASQAAVSKNVIERKIAMRSANHTANTVDWQEQYVTPIAVP